MKVSVITRHAVTNYGSFFQTYATQQVLQKLGCEPEIIDYIRTDEHYKNITSVLLKNSKKWNANPLTRCMYRLLRSYPERKSGKVFEAFRKKHLKLSPHTIDSFEGLKALPTGTYCTGSDQVWGAIGGDAFDPAYFLAFASEGSRLISYAASFGKTTFDEHTLPTAKKYLSRYDCISVREKSAAQIVADMGYSSVAQVLDPTLLLSGEEWASMISEDIKGEYILVYQLHANPQMDAYVKQFAKRKKLPLIRITPSLHQLSRGGRMVYLPELGQWLSYVKNATYMITDSFHGTAFALSFGTQFMNISPGLTSTRNMSILQLTGLESRMLRSYDDFSLFDTRIDFAPVHEKIAAEREKSLQWLKQAIFSGCEDNAE